MNKGGNGEVLYPYQDRPDFTFEIDLLIEQADPMLNKLAAFLKNNIDKMFPEFLNSTWPQFLQILERQLAKNQVYSRKHLVGMTMSLADIVVGSHIMRLVYNKSNPKCSELAAVMKLYPLTHVWAQETINGTFFGWMQTQVPGPL